MEYKTHTGINSKLSFLFKKLWAHFSIGIKFKLSLLIILTLVSIVLEVVSLSAVMPFLTSLTSPESIYNHPSLFPLFRYFGFENSSEIVFPISYMFISLVLLSMVLKIIILKAQLIFSAQIGNELSIKAYSKIINQSYLSHKSMNTSELIASIVNNVNIVVFHVIFFVALMVSSIIFTLTIFLLIFIITPKEAAIGFSVILLFYLFQAYLLKPKMKANSEIVVNQQNNIIKSLHVALGGIRNIILDKTHNFFVDTYKKTDITLRSALASNLFYAQFPRNIIEGGVIVSFILGALYIQSSSEYVFLDFIPVLGALALAAVKLLPYIQQIYRSWSTINGAHANFEDVIDLLEMNSTSTKEDKYLIDDFYSLEIKQASFRYNEHSANIFNEINLKIDKGDKIGVVGSTGGGKSTLIDILMGLLDPTSGKILINGHDIQDVLNGWHQIISVVPQEIFICEGDFYQNIAFGVEKNNIDNEKVKEVSLKAELYEFINKQKDGFRTLIYENGSNLSGGQKQRIAIARALYKKSKFVVFDEATSSLDDITEKRIIKSIQLLNKNEITILMIAHRLTTLESCDKIVEVTNKNIVLHNSVEDYKNSKSM